MEKCAYCDNKTQLYYKGVPVCRMCEDKYHPEKESPTASYNSPPRLNPPGKTKAT